MNLSQMIDEVNKDIDDTLDSADITGWINRALDDLTPIARKEAKITTEIAPTISLPDDLFEIALLMAGDSELLPVSLRDKTSKGYKVWGNELTLQHTPSEGELEVYYFKRLAHLTQEEDVPEIDTAYHDLLILYAIAHTQYADEEPERQVDAMNRYLARKREYEAFMFRSSNQDYQITDVTRW